MEYEHGVEDLGLARLFALYDADPMDLVFYLKDMESEKVAEATRFELRKKYWTYALPIIQKQHAHRGSFSNCNPGTSNTMSGYFGISGFNISCIANYDSARIDFYMGKGDAAQNKAAFDVLFAHKDEIESELGVSLTWERADEYKASWLCYHLYDVGITNEADWPRMAKFHAEWSDKICNAVLPYAGFTTDKGKVKEATKNQELLEMVALRSDFTEQDIIDRDNQIFEGFIRYLEENDLLQ